MSDVVMVTNAVAPDKLGGLERYVRELSAALVRRGHRVAVVAKRVDPDDPPARTEADGVQVHRHAVPSKRNPAFAALYPAAVARGVAAALAELPDAVVHCHFAVPALPLTSRRRRRRYLYTFHAPVHKELLAERNGSYTLPRPVQPAAVRALRAAEARVVRAADRLTVLSRFMADELRALDAGCAERTVLVPGGIDTDWFSPGPAPSAHSGWPGEGPVLFAARRHTPRTGVVELVRAMARVVAVRPDARLALAGDGPLRPEVERLVAELGLADHVRLLGRVDDDDLRAWYRRADLTVVPTAELEGFGLATAESMACGTPAAVTPVGANPELVRDVDPGLVLDGATPDLLASGLLRLLQDLPRVAALGERCRRHAVAQWSWDVVCTRFEDLYDQASVTATAGGADVRAPLGRM